ncbi:related to Cut9 interacting protein scn1 [Cephalotrichum gorgonifer]|uniref:Related to Cut9 interacting protein scn1 n=1 Tax=Cephalotrichum gorgonifer TaxID=2041049 RepID=A0AAE8MVS2_9PEZI|nr:related to Cut9 interacting protein scn1 [Cephalotrichum gorgonifer]
MCGDGGGSHGGSHTRQDAGAPNFPWDAGAFDAHCHPTDTMASVALIPGMKARGLAIMATRSQDQDLVSEVASRLGATHKSDFSAPETTTTTPSSSSAKVIPSFGWHPWFSHQLLNDTDAAAPTLPPDPTNTEAVEDFKAKHYASILAPPPTDPSFIAQLPTPTSLSAFLTATRSRLAAHPGAALVGEIGLDKAFRLPGKWADGGPPRDESLTPGGREGRKLSPHGVTMAHQVAVFRAHLALAGELGLPVSVHGVQAHGVLYDTIAALWKGYERDVLSKRERNRVAPHAEDWSSSSSEEDEDEDQDQDQDRPARKEASKDKGAGDVKGKPFPPRICLHSFSGSTEVLRRYLKPQVPADVYFSLSMAVNLGTSSGAERFADVVGEIPGDRILVESDLHAAGAEMDDALEDMYRRVCEVKGWELRDGVERIGRNFEAFVFG